MNEQSLKDRLRLIAQEKKMQFNACWKQLLLERFLIRLTHSSYKNRFIFKGGFLLGQIIKIGRETIDLDFLVARIKAEEAVLQPIFEEIAHIDLKDGFVFDLDNTESLSQPHMEYSGLRMNLNAKFMRMKDKIHIDVGVGDVVEPKMKEIRLLSLREQPLFEKSISLLAYPVESILAEKLETVLSKGAGNSRMKDYHDLVLLLRTKNLLNLGKLKVSINETFTNRKTIIRSVKFKADELFTLQRLWSSHLKGLGNMAEELKLPITIEEVIEEINGVMAIF
ncbi:MAG: nucleotidyl transferase AbiEii/AbiGii toxin family protein [Verrucomicrobia bacterium]|nr:nucleotidyl transferase AbiEii/AbiGii toxin family protein [Verrucomicrobiota bacterium]